MKTEILLVSMGNQHYTHSCGSVVASTHIEHTTAHNSSSYQIRKQNVSGIHEPSTKKKANTDGYKREGPVQPRVLCHLNSGGQEGPVGGGQHYLW